MVRLRRLEHTSCDSESCHEIIDYCPDGSLCLDCGGQQAIYPDEWYSSQDNDVQPVQMQMPIGQCPWLIDDMQLFFATRKEISLCSKK